MTADGPALLDRSLIGQLADLDLNPDAGNAFVAALYEEFERNARRALDRMRAGAHCGEGGFVAREAHRLKGSSGSIGAKHFAHSCREIEQCARGSDAAALRGSLEAAERSLEATVEALATLLERRLAIARPVMRRDFALR